VVAEKNEANKLTYKAIDSCLVFLPMIHGKQLITVENLAITVNGEKKLHPVQQAMLEMNGSQCGYCTPGIVMSLFGLYKNHNNPSREVVEEALTGNLCRCTGYQPIIEAAQKACVYNGFDHFSEKENEIIALLKKITDKKETLILRNKNQKYFKPFTLNEALKIRKENPNAIIINGSTDVALRQTKKHELFPEILDLSGVADLKNFYPDEYNYCLGTGITLEQLRQYSVSELPPLNNILNVFGSLQIRNIATIGGNVGSASPIGDTLPVLFAYKAKITVSSSTSERTINIEDFIKGYRQTDVKEDELITKILIPKSQEGYVIRSYKVSKRKHLDISTVSAAFRLHFENEIVSEIILAYGGMAATTKRAVETEKYLAGKRWSRENVMEAMNILVEEFAPLSDARSEAEFRTTVAKNILLKFYLDTEHKS